MYRISMCICRKDFYMCLLYVLVHDSRCAYKLHILMSKCESGAVCVFYSLSACQLSLMAHRRPVELYVVNWLNLSHPF